MVSKSTGRWTTVAFCAAHLLSAFGYEFAFFMMTLHAYGRHGNAADVALFSVLTFLPRLFAPLLGDLVDRFPRGRLFAGTLLLGGVCAAMIPFTRWILVPWTSLAILSVLFGIVRTALMTHIMEDQGHLIGNAAMLLSLNAARLAAPLAGALAAVCLSFRVSMLVAGCVFVLGALCAGQANVTTARPVRRSKGSMTGILKGFSELWNNGDLRFIFLLSLAWRLFLGFQISVFVVFIKRNLGGSDADYGFFMTYLSLGSLLGSLVGPWIASRVAATTHVKVGMGLHFISFIALSGVHTLVSASAVAIPGFAVLYASVVGIHSVRDRVTAAASRGRVFGANTMVLSVAGMVSMLAGGRLADLIGVNLLFLVAGTLSLATVLLLHVFSRPLGAVVQMEA